MIQLSTDQSKQTLPDIQSTGDTRNVSINRVGVTNVRYPITLCVSPGETESKKGSQTATHQHTVASFNMFVSLPEHEKGTHMSRFIEVLNDYHEKLCADSFVAFADSLCEKLNAKDSYLEVSFPYFIDKAAPVTGQHGKLDIDVLFEITAGAVNDFVMTLKIPATSLCPCSKEISAYGAHNQRCEMTVKVRVTRHASLWIDELFAMIEQCASTQVFSTLKRPDEKWVTEKAYENPKFVEDIVRDMAVAMQADDRIEWFQCFSENFESIHNHNAYAFVEGDKRSDR